MEPTSGPEWSREKDTSATPGCHNGDLRSRRHVPSAMTATTGSSTGDVTSAKTGGHPDKNRNCDVTLGVNTNAQGLKQAGNTCYEWCYGHIADFFIMVMSIVIPAIVLAAYCVAGAFLFIHLEGPGENNTRKSLDEIHDQYLEEVSSLCNISSDPNLRTAWEETLHVSANNSLTKYKNDLLNAGAFDENGKSKWTFVNSLVFTVTIVTTIGYGNIAPATRTGQIACMIYGVFGIPVTLISIANVGYYMATILKFIWPLLLRFLGVKSSKEKGSVPGLVCILLVAGYLQLGTFLFKAWEGWSYIDALYFCFITLSTIGYGDLIPGVGHHSETASMVTDMNEKLVMCLAYVLLGLSLLAMTFEIMQFACRDFFRKARGCLGRKQDKDAQRGAYGDVGRPQTSRYYAPGRAAANFNTNADFSECTTSLFRKCARSFTNFMVFIMSTAGLYIFVGFYCLGGALLFQYLERPPGTSGTPHAVMKNNTMVAIARMCEVEIFPQENSSSKAAATGNSSKPESVKFKEDLEKLLDNFKRDLFNLTDDIAWDDNGLTKWTVINALVFTVTTVTTIGYGNLAPVTEVGRGVCILYSLIGIPLCLMCLTNTGFYMARLCRFLYARVIFRACYPADEQARVPLWVCLSIIGGYLYLGARMFEIFEDWDFWESFYFCFITLTTIGLGDYVPEFRFKPDLDIRKEIEEQVAAVVYLLFGIALLTMSLDLMKLGCLDIFRCVAESLGCGSKDNEGDATAGYPPGTGREPGGYDEYYEGETPRYDYERGMQDGYPVPERRSPRSAPASPVSYPPHATPPPRPAPQPPPRGLPLPPEQPIPHVASHEYLPPRPPEQPIPPGPSYAQPQSPAPWPAPSGQPPQLHTPAQAMPPGGSEPPQGKPHETVRELVQSSPPPAMPTSVISPGEPVRPPPAVEPAPERHQENVQKEPSFRSSTPDIARQGEASGGAALQRKRSFSLSDLSLHEEPTTFQDFYYDIAPMLYGWKYGPKTLEQGTRV